MCVKHHYVPQFLLRRWTNRAGKLHIFAIRNGKLVWSERTPEYTGYENGLYALIAKTFGYSEDHLEKKLFVPIDNNAAKVLEKLERHVAITQDEHLAWTFFLSSLRMRQPDTLEFLRTQGIVRLKQRLAEQDIATLPPDWSTTEQWLNHHFPGAMEVYSLASWLPIMIAQPSVMDAFGALNWWFHEFKPEAPKLLLSDLPIHWEGGFNEPTFLIQLPIAPDRVFFGARSKETEHIIKQMSGADLIRRVNRTTLASSSDRIWALNGDEAKKFIEDNIEIMGKNVVRFSSLVP